MQDSEKYFQIVWNQTLRAAFPIRAAAAPPGQSGATARAGPRRVSVQPVRIMFHRRTFAGLKPNTAGTGSGFLDRAKAREKAMKLAAGIIPRVFQLLTAEGPTPANFAAAAVPPRASITSSTESSIPLNIHITWWCQPDPLSRQIIAANTTDRLDTFILREL
jgi:hypothetical protein